MSAGCAADSEEDGADGSEAVVGGRSELRDLAVGFVTIRDAGTPGGSDPVVCSGTLIEPDVVLTAAHCAGTGVMGFGVGPANAWTEWSEAKVMYLHPAWDPKHPTNGFDDIAVMKLEKPIASVPPLKLSPSAPGLLDRLFGKEFLYIGYGKTEQGATGLRKSFDLTLRASKNGVLTATSTNGGNCFGDSGGPLIEPTSQTVTGVLSYIWEGKCFVGNLSGFTDVALNRPFIDRATACNYAPERAANAKTTLAPSLDAVACGP